MADGNDRWRWAGRGVILAAAVVAVVGARPYAGAWNDGSRLAAVESLGDRGTFVIDDSVFVKVPPAGAGRPPPYPAFPPNLLAYGTLDKLLIGGHFYSDKSPVPSVLMAGLYRGWLALGGPTAAERPDLFCYFLAVATSGLAYVVAVGCVRRLAGVVGLIGRTRVLLTFGFAAATVAPAYTRHVNTHAVFLGVAAALCLTLAKAGPGLRWGRAALIGSLAGFGYTLDLGVGPPLVVCVAVFAAAVTRRARPVAIVILAAAPWVAAHHALNYAVGGTWVPANAVPEYLRWPGSPFTEQVMTGGLKHTPLGFLLYAGDLLFGNRGFLVNNFPLWLAPGGAVLLWRGAKDVRPAVAFSATWPALGWLAYAATSTNLSGMSCSIRWFVPFLAPGFWVLALLLKHRPQYTPDLAWLTAVGAGLAALMWRNGPWPAKLPPGLLGWVAVALIGWGAVRLSESRRRSHKTGNPPKPTDDRGWA